MSSRTTSRTFHLFWGFLLYFCGKLMDSLTPNLMRGTFELRASQAFSLIVISEILTLCPFAPTLIKNWGLRSAAEWAVFLSLALSTNLTCIGLLFCSQRMSLGTLAAIIIGVILCTPIMLGFVHRRCISVVDFVGIVLALIGLAMVAQPNSLLHFIASDSHPAIPVFVAIFTGLVQVCFPFAIGFFQHVHWTNYAFLRCAISVVVVPVYLTIDDGWSLPPASSWSGVVLCLQIGAVINLLRISAILGCQELEAWAPGTAGVVGNVLNTCLIPLVASLAFALYGEVMTPLEIGGAAVIFFSAATLAAIKFFLEKSGDADEDPGCRLEKRPLWHVRRPQDGTKP